MPNAPEVLETIGVVTVATLYGLTLIALSLYGLNFLYLVFVAWRHRRDHVDVPPLGTYPMVTLQIPIYNERYVAERAIEAACRLDWPRDRLEIQVLDDSTDATREIVAQAVARLRAGGVDIVHLHRTVRSGYKAGALREGLSVATGEFIAIFDADFVSPPDFLLRSMPHFAADERIGFVQARWGHLNREASLLTMLQSLSLDGHFAVEQFARDRGGYIMNFNGTAGVWRRRAIDDAGSWSASTLTEDLDLSYRAALRGWKSRLLSDLVAPAELVGEMSAYRRQQTRWAQGNIECARRLLPRMWRSRLAQRAKLQAFFHFTSHLMQPLALILSLIYPWVVWSADHSPLLRAMYSVGWIFTPVAMAPTLFFAYAQIILDRRRWLSRAPYLFALTVLGSGMVLNGSRAIVRGLRGRSAVFERTPKLGQIGRRPVSVGHDYRLPFDTLVFGEIGLCLFNLHTAWLAASARAWSVLLYAAIFAAGFAYVASLSLWQSRHAIGSALRAWWAGLRLLGGKARRAAQFNTPRDP